MSKTTTSLGGRLPLAERSALTGAQAKLFDRLVTEAVPWAQRAGFVMQSADGALIGPFNPLLESPEISASFWDWQVAEERYTTLSGRERQVVILAVGAVWHAPYELYAHSAAGRTAGLSPEQVDILAGGGMPEDYASAPAHRRPGHPRCAARPELHTSTDDRRVVGECSIRRILARTLPMVSDVSLLLYAGHAACTIRAGLMAARASFVRRLGVNC
jgi:4-carboxymuconolactone decarboxylase